MVKRTVCVISGSRAEYGLLQPIMKEIKKDADLILQVVAAGMHLSPEFGLTYKKIEEDGFIIDEKVEMLLSTDTGVGTAKSIGLGVIGFADVFDRLKPDIVLLLGDRYEILAAAQAALILRIPVAHIAGGDSTEGAFDESIRHSITKMAHLHFVNNEVSAMRVRQLGENPDYIFNVGSPGIDTITRLDLLSRQELEQALGFRFRSKNFLITFHPATLDQISSAQQLQEIFKAIDCLDLDLGVIFTHCNADPEGRIINLMIDDYVAEHSRARAFSSLGQRLYLSTIAQVDAVVGNSSSGLYEVPSFKKPTVNIGSRQSGRIQASSIINCQPEAADIIKAIEEAFMMDCSNCKNPYGDGNASSQIAAILKSIPNYKDLLIKPFFTLEC
ncbi:MAG: UDP-N-acetylglucosamine 2-epimerase [Chitinophagales bacterium]